MMAPSSKETTQWLVDWSNCDAPSGVGLRLELFITVKLWRAATEQESLAPSKR